VSALLLESVCISQLLNPFLDILLDANLLNPYTLCFLAFSIKISSFTLILPV